MTSFSGCDSTHTLTVVTIPKLFLQLPGDLTLDIGESVVIQSVTLQSDLIFVWMPDKGLNCSDCPNPVAQPLETTNYVLTIIDAHGCSSTENILIMVNKAVVFAPNVFSPNGDGINDYFYLQGKGISIIKNLRIFDRWGNMVFEKTNIPANDESYGWDGTFRKKPMNPAIFAWYATVIFADGTENVEKCDLLLIR